MTEKRLVFVTGNAEKLREVREILADGNPLDLESRAIDLLEIQGSTSEVSLEKCRRAAEIVGGPCITEDTALCFEALNGLPGPYIKFFLQGLGHEGLNKMLDGFETRRAWALCTFAFCEGPGAEPVLFEGRTDGQIVRPRGPPKFGWDAVFEPLEGGGKTYAELGAAVKNKISHRYRALAKLREFLHDREKRANR